MLVSTKDGQVIRNLTGGFDKDRGFEYITLPGGLRGNIVPILAWAPIGDRLAYFVRTEKERTLIIENIVSGKTEKRVDLRAVDGPESPTFSPDGKKVAFSAMQNGVQDIFTVDVDSGAIENLTKDATADYAPTFSPDGQSIVYTARIGSADKLFRLDLKTNVKTQLTFGSQDDTAAKFYDDHTVVFTSTAVDPKVTLTPEMAATATSRTSGRSISTPGLLTQWTDTLTGNVSPVVLKQSDGRRSPSSRTTRDDTAFTSFRPDKTPIATASVSDFGGPGPDRRVHGADQPHGHPRQHPPQGRVGKDEPRRPAAHQHRLHDRRQHLRQHGDHVQRRARRQAGQFLRPIGGAVPGRRRSRTRTRSAVCGIRCRDSRPTRSTTARTSKTPARSTIRRSRRSSRATWPNRSRASAAARCRRSIRSTNTRASSSRPGYLHLNEHYTDDTLQAEAVAYQIGDLRLAAASATAACCPSACPS